MIIECPACTSRYRIREDKLPEAGGNIKCPNCAHIFFVPRGGSQVAAGSGSNATEPLAQALVTPAPSLAPSPPDAAAQRPVGAPGGARRWKLKNPVGLVYDFPDTDQLRTWLSSRESFDGFQVSADAGATWAAVADVSDLEGVRPTGRKSMGPQAALSTLTFGGASTQRSTTGPNTGQFPTSAEQMREEAEARLREARATRRDDSASVSGSVAQFQIIKPPANRQQEQTSRILLLLALLILPLIAAVGLHIVGVIDLADYGLLPGPPPAPVVAITDEPDEGTGDQGPRRPELTPEQAVTMLMNQAAAAQSRGEPAVAVAHLERAVEIMPDDVELQCLLQPIYAELGRPLDAQRAAERCRSAADGSAAGAAPQPPPAAPAPAPASAQAPAAPVDGQPAEASPAEPQTP